MSKAKGKSALRRPKLRGSCRGGYCHSHFFGSGLGTGPIRLPDQGAEQRQDGTGQACLLPMGQGTDRIRSHAGAYGFSAGTREEGRSGERRRRGGRCRSRGRCDCR